MTEKKYTCFVCGVQFDSIPECKSHIIENHEEGRDYIKCPLRHCQAPIRDLRSHFKVYHSTIPMPQVGMTRPIIWRDSKEQKKRKKPKFKEGWFESTKMKKRLHYRSGYELSIYECLDVDNDVDKFGEEPFKIPYTHKGEVRQYIPDLVVKYKDGRTELWEIKPSKQTSLEINKDKWSAAASACNSSGWKFVVITEQGINQLKQKVTNQSKNTTSSS